MALAFALMVWAASREAQSRSVPLQGAGLPAPLVVNDQRDQRQVCRFVNSKGEVCRPEEGQLTPYDAGRLFYDPTNKSLRAVGVFPDHVRDDIVRDTAPADFVKKIEELQEKSAKAANGPKGWNVEVQLDQEPSNFDLQYYAGEGHENGNRAIKYDRATRTLTATIELEDKEIKGLKVSAGDPQLRDTLNDLMKKADASRVSPWWLVWFYLLATVGELCLAPVGLSMVSQLAPARFATMLMGLWLLTFAFAGFIAGAFGEQWGTWSPMHYFVIVLALMVGATVLLFAISRKIGSLMHEGK
jgi:POT family proton-dependent oligopeptide transporter